MAELVDEYAELPLGGTGASTVTLAEPLDIDIVTSLDGRHFSAVRTRQRLLGLLTA